MKYSRNSSSITSHQYGFTLLEVLVALAIVAIGIAGVSKVVHSSLKVSQEVELRLLANWTASNHLANLRLSKYWISAGIRENKIQMGGHDWRVVEDATATADPDITRVDVHVSLQESPEQKLASLFGYKVKLSAQAQQL